jgi:hypothetical protein
MDSTSRGATYGDALIALIAFAREEPIKFVLVVGFTLGVALGVRRIIWSDTKLRYRRAFEERRRKVRDEEGPRLPLE